MVFMRSDISKGAQNAVKYTKTGTLVDVLSALEKR
jgi:hypothetical protein